MLFEYDIVIIYHGFDSLPNSLTTSHVNQVAMSRDVRGKKTLILERFIDQEINYPPMGNTPVKPKDEVKSKPGAVKVDTADLRTSSAM